MCAGMGCAASASALLLYHVRVGGQGGDGMLRRELVESEQGAVGPSVTKNAPGARKDALRSATLSAVGAGRVVVVMCGGPSVVPCRGSATDTGRGGDAGPKSR